MEDRAVPGHWEGDLLVGSHGSSHVATLVERQPRYVMLAKVDNIESQTVIRALILLTRLPLDSLKVDRTFVKNMTLSPEGRVLVHAIISLAHLLKMNVVAEGVETEEQSDCLKLLSCNEVQGFLFSKPLPADLCLPFIQLSVFRSPCGHTRDAVCRHA